MPAEATRSQKTSVRTLTSTPTNAAELFADGSLDATALALQYGGTEGFWRKRMDDGELPFVRVGAKRLVPRRAVLAYFERRLVPSKV